MTNRQPSFVDQDLFLLWLEKRNPEVLADLDNGVLRLDPKPMRVRWLRRAMFRATSDRWERVYMGMDK